MTEHVIVNINRQVMVISIQRPEKKNAITQAMYVQMAQAIQNAEKNPEVRVLLIRGTNDCFTSGNDLADFFTLSGEIGATAASTREFMWALRDARKPVVAAVTGFAMGIGTTLLLHCDLVYATQTARFQLPFASLGLCPEFGASYLLPMLLGRSKASELLLLGEPFGADKACEFGIVNAVLEESEFFEAVEQRVARLVAMPPNALRTTKALIKSATGKHVNESMETEFQQFFSLLQAPEAKEALDAFLQKRKPDFSRF